MSRLVWILILLLAIFHQDNWFWNDGHLVFGFMPIGLFYHACISVAAAVVWFMALKYCWPDGLNNQPQVPPSAESRGT